jgi:hypothetical protein
MAAKGLSAAIGGRDQDARWVELVGGDQFTPEQIEASKKSGCKPYEINRITPVPESWTVLGSQDSIDTRNGEGHGGIKNGRP